MQRRIVRKQGFSGIRPDNFAVADSRKRAGNVPFPRKRQDFTDLGMGHSLNMKHGDDGSVFIRQFHHGLVQSSLELGQVGFPHRAARGGQLDEFLVVLNARVHVVEAEVETAAPFLQEIQRHVDRDGVDPGVERRFAAETADRFVGLGENILEQIVRVLVIRGHVVDQAVKARGIFHDELVERGGVARLGARDKLLVFVGSRLIHRLALRFSTRPQRPTITNRITASERRQCDGGVIFFNRPRDSAAIAHRKEPEQVAQRGDERGHIGQRGGVQNLIHADGFLARLDDSHLLQNDFRATRRVEFNRQSDQLEDEQDQVAINAERDQTR